MAKIGTYVGLRVLEPSNKSIVFHCLGNGIPIIKSIFEERLHTTVIYSRKHCPNIKIDPTKKYRAEFDHYEIFSGQKGEYALVMVLKCDELTFRHHQLMQDNKATYDFETYHPHITLHYNYPDNSTLGLTPYLGTIVLGEEYVEDLNLDWKS